MWYPTMRGVQNHSGEQVLTGTNAASSLSARHQRCNAWMLKGQRFAGSAAIWHQRIQPATGLLVFVASLHLLGAAELCRPAQSQEQPAATESAATDFQENSDQLLTAPEVTEEDLTQEDYSEVIQQLSNKILPEAKKMLQTARQGAGSSVPSSFQQALETVVLEAQRLLEQAGSDSTSPAANVKATADGIEQQLIVFRSLFDIPDK